MNLDVKLCSLTPAISAFICSTICIVVSFISCSNVIEKFLCALVAPLVTVPHREVSQQVGATTILTCLILTNPIGTFTWLHNGRKLSSEGRYEVANWTVGEYQHMFAVTIHDLVVSDYGAYKCVADNGFGRSEGDMSIFGMCAFIFGICLF